AKRPDRKNLEIKMEDVRPIPQVALKVIRMMNDMTHSMQDIAREIRKNQIISAKVLKLCNSAFFAEKSNIDTIDRALVLMGEKQFLQLVISASIEDFFPENGHGYSLCKGGLYKHALGTAMICKNLARHNGQISPELAYTAGLLHDIGKVALDQFMASSLPFFYRQTQIDGGHLIDLENKVFGIDHTTVGGRLAEKWALPEILIDAIKHHHHPDSSTVNPELTNLVYLADLLMSRFMAGHDLDGMGTEDLTERLRMAHFTSGQLPLLINLIPPQVFSAHYFMDMNETV
ncbi:MAG: HDOD domain-containing protein, partial [Deltaproteobacteria bacterium]|nr:HDOD domain-containing protein [Deltaproteobacteria bacterium]